MERNGWGVEGKGRAKGQGKAREKKGQVQGNEKKVIGGRGKRSVSRGLRSMSCAASLPYWALAWVKEGEKVTDFSFYFILFYF